jgi:Kdo2-lipid IVA lauroyltransferase/acyltransferase
MLLKTCQALPLSWLHALGRFWGSILVLIPNRARATTQTNLALCFPDKTNQEIADLTRASLQNTACTALEMGKAWIGPIENTLALVSQTRGLAEFRAALESNQGVILLAPHLSNWEVFGFAACDGAVSNFMYKPPKIAAMDRLLRETRSRSGVNLAPANRQGVAQLLKALKAGELVGILPDQVPEADGGEYADFYGQTALTMALASRLLQRVNATVFCGFAKRLPKAQGFELIIMPADPAVYSEDLATSVAGVNRSVELCVNEAIDQYQWEYKRFRRQPDDRDLYRKA